MVENKRLKRNEEKVLWELSGVRDSFQFEEGGSRTQGVDIKL